MNKRSIIILASSIIGVLVLLLLILWLLSIFGHRYLSYEQVEDKRNNQDVGNKIALQEAIKSLTKRERDILNNRYIIGKTQTELSEELGISQAQVSRIESNAIKTLKKTLK